MAQAKAAAGDGDVVVQGAYTAQRALKAGVLDELQIHQIPVLLGGGRRLFNVPLFTRVRGIEILRSSHTRSSKKFGVSNKWLDTLTRAATMHGLGRVRTRSRG